MTRDGPLWLVILAVGTGAGLGAVCRWMLSYFLNPPAGEGRRGCAGVLGLQTAAVEGKYHRLFVKNHDTAHGISENPLSD